MTETRPLQWTKSHGLGNDYLVIEPAALPTGIRLTPASVRLICDRHHGIGSDGILELLPPTGEPNRFALRIWNPDGSEAEKSGNGLRIFAKYLCEHGHTAAERFTIATPGGAAEVAVLSDPASRLVNAVTVNMGIANFDPRTSLTVQDTTYDVSILSVGNPHCVVFVRDLTAVELHTLGPAIETHAAFPARTNVQFAMPVDRQLVRALIWERGAGETLASGSSATAVAAAAHRRGLVGGAVTVAMPGGDLTVEIDANEQLWLTGPVEEVCQGTLSADLLARLRLLAEESAPAEEG